MKRFSLLIIVVLFTASFALSQQSVPEKPQEPSFTEPAPDVLETFKSRTDLVMVPIVVRDKHGKAVEGLAKDAFHVEENGKEQDISVFEEVHTIAASGPNVAIDRGYSNLPFDDTHQLRLIVIVLDLLNTSPLQRSDGKDQLLKFLSKGLAQNQPVSLLCITKSGLQLVQPFTSGAEVLIQALKKLDLGPQTIMPRQEAIWSTLKQLDEIALGYSGIPGRKTMIFAAGRIPRPPLTSGGGTYTELPHAAYESYERTWRDLINSNIAVYPIELMDWASSRANSRREFINETSLRSFAEDTGGDQCSETNGLFDCLKQAVEDSRSYYMVGFSVRPDDRKPGWRDLKVKVGVDHADIRSRSGFYYGVGEASTAQSVRDAEINALASPLAYSAVPMYIHVTPPSTTAPDAATGKKTVEFLLIIPLGGVRIDPSSSNPLDLEVGGIALTRDIREAGEFLHPVQGKPDADLLKKFAHDGIRLREKLELPPGYYDVRLMIRDNNASQIGTVVFPLEVKK